MKGGTLQLRDDALELACQQKCAKGEEDDISLVRYLVEKKGYKVTGDCFECALSRFNLNIFSYLLQIHPRGLGENAFRHSAKTRKKMKPEYVLSCLRQCEELTLDSKAYYRYFITTYGLNSYDDTSLLEHIQQKKKMRYKIKYDAKKEQHPAFFKFYIAIERIFVQNPKCLAFLVKHYEFTCVMEGRKSPPIWMLRPQEREIYSASTQ